MKFTETQTEQIKNQVNEVYSKVADEPADKFPFPIGREFAESVGYPADVLDSLPKDAVESFAGVSNVSVFAEIETGDTVLDLGCGSGLDSMIASRQTGLAGSVFSIDFSESMLKKFNANMGDNFNNIELKKCSSEDLPIPENSIDKVIINGIFNLNPDREKIFKEIHRVLKPGGKVFAAEIVLIDELETEAVADPDNWFA